MICQRCGKETNVHKMSFLNTQEICMECAEKEINHPVYQFGKRIEYEEVKGGNYNFQGVLDGLVCDSQAEENLIARIKYQDTPENIFKAWDMLLNNMSYKASKAGRLLRVNGINYTDEATAWIAYMANTSRVDGRNEDSQRECKKINYGSAMETQLCMRMARNHPTIQQLFTAAMLSYWKDEDVSLPYI